jgi:hypothetical protein
LIVLSGGKVLSKGSFLVAKGYKPDRFRSGSVQEADDPQLTRMDTSLEYGGPAPLSPEGVFAVVIEDKAAPDRRTPRRDLTATTRNGK